MWNVAVSSTLNDYIPCRPFPSLPVVLWLSLKGWFVRVVPDGSSRLLPLHGAALWEGFLGGTSVEEPARQWRRHKRYRFDPWVWKILWRRTGQPPPVFLPGESHGQSSLAGYSPWGLKELDTTEAASHTHPVRAQKSHPQIWFQVILSGKTFSEARAENPT